jgi:hypothetical protein
LEKLRFMNNSHHVSLKEIREHSEKYERTKEHKMKQKKHVRSETETSLPPPKKFPILHLE